MNPAHDPQIDLSVSSFIGSISPELRESMIAEAAYFRAEARGFGLGGELEDWLDAEQEIDQRLAERELDVAADGA